jgi:hypothetical protein
MLHKSESQHGHVKSLGLPRELVTVVTLAEGAHSYHFTEKALNIHISRCNGRPGLGLVHPLRIAGDKLRNSDD